ncbi:MAG: flagellar basal body L-ring protein FlgH [Nitrospinae bacterium]|nr:flagellar basal body L-ring protein FlgH [Nitrospinota bacterium]
MKTLYKNSSLLLLTSFFILLNSGCAKVESTSVVKTLPQDLIIEEKNVVAPTEGSLWPGNSNQNLLFTDNKARKVNDIVTIKITETASATGAGSTATSGDSTNSYGINGMFGVPSNSATVLGGIGSSALTLSTRGASSYDGSGSTSKTGSLTTTVSAVITEVLPNGNMRVKGSRMIRLNNDIQIMTVEGIIRPSDIGYDNSILSTQIAEAKIAYAGTGVIMDKQGPGWGQQLFDKVWPF